MSAAANIKLSEEDLLRAQTYAFLSNMLLSPPDAATLDNLAALQGDESDIGKGYGALAERAGAMGVQDVAEEYQDLFIGIGRGELVPFGSYYLTGFLNEKPLADLRATMGRLGIARAEGVKEPEDHIGSLCEMMSGLIIGSYGTQATPAVQKQMFTDHIARWGGHFFADLEKAQTAKLYAPLGTIGKEFIAIEAQAFEMD
ncbi:MAG: molecular chaperone TorD family protein [Pseudomonadota bacterium]